MSSGQITYDVNELTVYDFFNYYPSLALACIALSLFTVAAVVIGVMTERRKTYRFMHLFTLTGLLEAGGCESLLALCTAVLSIRVGQQEPPAPMPAPPPRHRYHTPHATPSWPVHLARPPTPLALAPQPPGLQTGR